MKCCRLYLAGRECRTGVSEVCRLCVLNMRKGLKRTGIKRRGIRGWVGTAFLGWLGRNWGEAGGSSFTVIMLSVIIIGRIEHS